MLLSSVLGAFDVSDCTGSLGWNSTAQADGNINCADMAPPPLYTTLCQNMAGGRGGGGGIAGDVALPRHLDVLPQGSAQCLPTALMEGAG